MALFSRHTAYGGRSPPWRRTTYKQSCLPSTDPIPTSDHGGICGCILFGCPRIATGRQAASSVQIRWPVQVSSTPAPVTGCAARSANGRSPTGKMATFPRTNIVGSLPTVILFSEASARQLFNSSSSSRLSSNNTRTLLYEHTCIINLAFCFFVSVLYLDYPATIFQQTTDINDNQNRSVCSDEHDSCALRYATGFLMKIKLFIT